MLRALGGRFLDKSNKEIVNVEKLIQLEKIDLDKPYNLLKSCQIIVMSDVDNPFIGEKGATYVFAKQKGANKKQIEILEKCLTRYNEIVKSQYKIDLAKIKKTGAAGGLGGAFYLLGTSLQSGIDTVLEVTQFEKHIQNADLIITGEGSIDSQTINGKTISGILKIAQKQQVPVIAFAGRVTNDIDALYELGLCSAFSITNEIKTLQEALNEGVSCLESTSYNVFKMIDLIRKR